VKHRFPQEGVVKGAFRGLDKKDIEEDRAFPLGLVANPGEGVHQIGVAIPREGPLPKLVQRRKVNPDDQDVFRDIRVPLHLLNTFLDILSPEGRLETKVGVEHLKLEAVDNRRPGVYCQNAAGYDKAEYDAESLGLDTQSPAPVD